YAMHVIPPERLQITPDCIPDHILEAVRGKKAAQNKSAPPKERPSMEQVMEDAGRRYLTEVLEENGGNISQTARVLGITRQNLQHRMKKLGVHP
ncbi:MAG: hypothetical protein IKM54_01190, partial [Butyricicoccus sp.]|nr:hypothetical protein [Butyricicoccus sp.]